MERVGLIYPYVLFNCLLLMHVTRHTWTMSWQTPGHPVVIQIFSDQQLGLTTGVSIPRQSRGL